MSAIYIADPAWTEADEQYWWAVTRPTPPGDPADSRCHFEDPSTLRVVGAWTSGGSVGRISAY